MGARSFAEGCAAAVTLAVASFGALAASAMGGCGFADVSTGKDSGAAADASASTADAAAPAVVGGGCGTERQSGETLCVATSMCPELVVDTQALPGCGFRVRGATVDLVCACGEMICPMGVFTTCAQARELLTSQTEGLVCAQVGEGRCTGPGATGGTSSSSSSSSGAPGCDKQCIADCGGGEACASVCGCT